MNKEDLKAIIVIGVFLGLLAWVGYLGHKADKNDLYFKQYSKGIKIDRN